MARLTPDGVSPSAFDARAKLRVSTTAPSTPMPFRIRPSNGMCSRDPTRKGSALLRGSSFCERSRTATERRTEGVRRLAAESRHNLAVRTTSAADGYAALGAVGHALALGRAVADLVEA